MLIRINTYFKIFFTTDNCILYDKCLLRKQNYYDTSKKILIHRFSIFGLHLSHIFIKSMFLSITTIIFVKFLYCLFYKNFFKRNTGMKKKNKQFNFSYTQRTKYNPKFNKFYTKIWNVNRFFNHSMEILVLNLAEYTPLEIFFE